MLPNWLLSRPPLLDEFAARGEGDRLAFDGAVLNCAGFPGPSFDGAGEVLCTEPLLLEVELPGLDMPSFVGVTPPTLCLNLLYNPLMPLLTSSLVPARLLPAPPSKSWKDVKVSDLEAEV